MDTKVGLTLGGGGARGAAHVGVLLELERMGIRPSVITGASIGGLVGALLAVGTTAAELRDLFERLTLTQLFSLPGSAPAITGNARVKRLLGELLGNDLTFADLQIPLAIVATDLVDRELVVIEEGNVLSAVLATISLPILLPPVERDGRILLDGGIINNVPFDVARKRGADFTLAIDLTNTAPYGITADTSLSSHGMMEWMINLTQRTRTWQVISTVVDILTHQSLNALLAISEPDLLLRPELGTVGLFDFHRWQECIEAGRAAVLEHEETLRKLK